MSKSFNEAWRFGVDVDADTQVRTCVFMARLPNVLSKVETRR